MCFRHSHKKGFYWSIHLYFFYHTHRSTLLRHCCVKVNDRDVRLRHHFFGNVVHVFHRHVAERAQWHEGGGRHVEKFRLAQLGQTGRDVLQLGVGQDGDGLSVG